MKVAKPTSVRVRYVETDQMGIVYHANYLIYFDIARTDWISQVWKPYTELEQSGYFMVVIDAQLKFNSPARFDDVLKIKVKLQKWNRVKLTFAYSIERESDSKLICTGTTSHCLVGREGVPQRFPTEFFNILNQD